MVAITAIRIKLLFESAKLALAHPLFVSTQLNKNIRPVSVLWIGLKLLPVLIIYKAHVILHKSSCVLTRTMKPQINFLAKAKIARTMARGREDCPRRI